MHLVQVIRFMRFPVIALAAAAVVACEEDNVFGLGPGNGTRYTAALTGAQVRPSPVATSATANASVTIREPDIGASDSTVAYTLTGLGLTGATAAHIHLGGAAISNGQILATLYMNPSDTAITSAQLASGVLAPAAIAVSLDSLAALMSSGAAYVDVHTRVNFAGLVRGQLAPNGETAPGERFAAPALSGLNERPTPVTTTATGSSTFEVLADGSVRYNVSVAGLAGATMAHIHTAAADSAGPIVVTLFTTSTPTGTLTGTLASGSFGASNIQLTGVSMDSLLSLMRRGRTYVNVHTATNPNGEIRGQIEPVTLLP
jgi:hypothetical protein